MGYYKALGGSGKSGGDTFHNLPPPAPPHPHQSQLGLFGMLSFSHKLKIIVKVAYSQNLTIGKCAVFEIHAIEVLFRKTNLAAKYRYDPGLLVFVVYPIFLSDDISYISNHSVKKYREIQSAFLTMDGTRVTHVLKRTR